MNRKYENDDDSDSRGNKARINNERPVDNSIQSQLIRLNDLIYILTQNMDKLEKSVENLHNENKHFARTVELYKKTHEIHVEYDSRKF